jgi:ureidoglycolate lyase
MDLRPLKVELPTPETFAPYGVLVGADPSRAPRASAFYEDKVELWAAGPYVNDADACLSIARIRPRRFEVVWMERHFHHTQTFIPLGGAPVIAVLGAPGEGTAPDPRSVRAFLFDGSAGFLLHVGTWHEFPFAVERVADVVVILRNETTRSLEAREGDEAVGGDLEKRNLALRLGYGFRFTPNHGVSAT